MSFQNDGANLKVKMAPSVRCEGFPSELPGEAAEDRQPAQGGDHPSPQSRAAHFALLRGGGINVLAPLRQSYLRAVALDTTASATFSVSGDRRYSWAQSAGHEHRYQDAGVGHSQSASVQCGQSSALCSTAAGRPGTGHRQSSRAGQPMSGTVPPRYGFAVVKPGRYTSRHCVIFALCAVLAAVGPAACDAAVRARQKRHRAFRAARKQPSRLLAQTVSVIANLFGSIRRRPESALPVTDCAGRTVFPGLTASNILPPVHRPARINDRAWYFYSADSACSRGPSSHASTPVPRSLLWSVPAQVPEAVCPPHRPLSLSAVWSLRSPARWPAKASSHPALPDRLRDQHSASLRVLGHWQTCRPPCRTGTKEYEPSIPPQPSCLQDCQQPRPPRKPTPRRRC